MDWQEMDKKEIRDGRETGRKLRWMGDCVYIDVGIRVEGQSAHRIGIQIGDVEQGGEISQLLSAQSLREFGHYHCQRVVREV